MPSQFAGIDEFKFGLFAMACVFVPERMVPDVHRQLRSLLRPSQRSLHFKKDIKHNRRQIMAALTQVADLGAFAIVYDASLIDENELAKRCACLRAIVADCKQSTVLVIDRDESLVRSDSQEIIEARHRRADGIHDRVSPCPPTRGSADLAGRYRDRVLRQRESPPRAGQADHPPGHHAHLKRETRAPQPSDRVSGSLSQSQRRDTTSVHEHFNENEFVSAMLTDPLSEAALSVWGKSDRNPGGEWMPLAQHLIDSADVAAYVWDWLPPHVHDLIEAALPADARDGRTLLRWLAGIHDVGKCSPQFAAQMPNLADAMIDAGFVFPRIPSEYRWARHELVGHHALETWLEQTWGASHSAASTYAVVVGGHHGKPPTAALLDALDGKRDARGSSTWSEVRDELLAAMATYVGADQHLAAWSATPLPTTTQAVLTGAVIVSDWIASNPELFPLTGQDARRADAGWRALELPPSWAPVPTDADVDGLCASRFPHLSGFDPRPVQRMAVEAARGADSTPLLIIESTMGSGKTEAGLLAAEILAERFDCGGLYVALPTMATSDAMFGRVLSWIGQLDGGQRLSTFLAHGKAGLNKDFRGLLYRGHTGDICDDDHSAAEASSWLMGRKKGVLATMTVGTIDQLLFMALQAKHVALRHLAFAGKVVIVDEVHAADEYMRVYLERALEWLGAYGVPVVLMSATLPRAQRQALADAYRKGLGNAPLPLPHESPYPALTTVTADDVTVVGDAADDSDNSRRISVRCLNDDPVTLASVLREALADGGCAAVIRNTVGRAQETAQYLRKEFPGIEVELIHSRFVATHRATKEERLRAQLGRDGERPSAKIVVGTQVLEQSLDVDFDVMVTDLAPVDLVLQRAGRLHRHRRGIDESERPTKLSTPSLFITGITTWEAGVPQPDRGSTVVYRPSRLLRAAAVLSLAEGGSTMLLLPRDLRPLVEEAYAEDAVWPQQWTSAIATADVTERAHTEEQRNEATRYLLPSPGEGITLVNWLGAGASTEAEDATSGASRVRDSEDSIEVLVVRRTADGEVRCLDDDKLAVYLQGEPPPNDVARTIMASSVRLPAWMTKSATDFDRVVNALERDGHASWSKSPWLKGQLALHLDEDLTAEVGGFHVSYSRDDGLVVERQSEGA